MPLKKSHFSTPPLCSPVPSIVCLEQFWGQACRVRKRVTTPDSTKSSLFLPLSRQGVVKKGTTEEGRLAEIRISPPPLWVVQKDPGGGGGLVEIQTSAPLPLFDADASPLPQVPDLPPPPPPSPSPAKAPAPNGAKLCSPSPIYRATSLQPESWIS